MAHKIKVMVGLNVKREAVLINPNVSAAEPTFAASKLDGSNDFPNNIIAVGETARGILKRIYGK